MRVSATRQGTGIGNALLRRPLGAALPLPLRLEQGTMIMEGAGRMRVSGMMTGNVGMAGRGTGTVRGRRRAGMGMLGTRIRMMIEEGLVQIRVRGNAIASAGEWKISAVR